MDADTSSYEATKVNPERTHAYRQVIHTLNELGPSKLQDSEQDRVRFAADNLIFCSDLADDVGTRWALDDVDRLCRSLVESGRWEQVTATRLAAEVAACGPTRTAELKAA